MVVAKWKLWDRQPSLRPEQRPIGRHLTLNLTFISLAISAQRSSDSDGMEPPTTDTVTPGILSLHSLMNYRIAG